MLVHILPVGNLETNCYLVVCEDTLDGLVVDPAAESERILAEVDRIGMRVLYVVNTHGHLDHVLANDPVRDATGAPLLIHSADAAYLSRPDPMLVGWLHGPTAFRAPDRALVDGQALTFGNCTLEVLHTPGHTPGGISLYGEGVVFTGDSLFNQGVGRTDLPGGNWQLLVHSIQTKLFNLPDETIVYPGHGSSTTIGDERTGNPYV
ncbi:MAG: MBL fold metallo-hydrolase [Chloroflexota bacterium]